MSTPVRKGRAAQPAEPASAPRARPAPAAGADPRPVRRRAAKAAVKVDKRKARAAQRAPARVAPLLPEPTIIDIRLPYDPRPWQFRAHMLMKRFSVFVVHSRGGKTVLATATLFDAALRCTKHEPRYAYIAPYRNQAKRTAWGYFCSFAHAIPGAVIHESELRVDLPNGARIFMLGADDPDAIRGIYLDGVVLDEIAQMRPQTWSEVIFPRLMDRDGWALFIGTPKGRNLLSKLYYENRADPEWCCRRWTVHDTGVFTDEHLRRARRTMLDAHYRQEFLCDFSAQTDNQLITVDQVMAAQDRVIEPVDYQFAPLILGVDVARYGNNRSVIFPRQGLRAFEPIVFRGRDNMTFAGNVAEQITKLGADACFIDQGGGGGVIDRLHQLGYRSQVVGVHFGGTDCEPYYLNKRAEMWAKMANWIKTGSLPPESGELLDDLCYPLYTYKNRANKLELESKDAMVARGMLSPDVGDSLALTFAYEVAARRRPRGGRMPAAPTAVRGAGGQSWAPGMPRRAVRGLLLAA